MHADTPRVTEFGVLTLASAFLVVPAGQMGHGPPHLCGVGGHGLNSVAASVPSVAASVPHPELHLVASFPSSLRSRKVPWHLAHSGYLSRRRSQSLSRCNPQASSSGDTDIAVSCALFRWESDVERTLLLRWLFPRRAF